MVKEVRIAAQEMVTSTGIPSGKAGASSKRGTRELHVHHVRAGNGQGKPSTSRRWQVLRGEMTANRLAQPSPEGHSLQSAIAKLQKHSTAIFLTK